MNLVVLYVISRLNAADTPHQTTPITLKDIAVGLMSALFFFGIVFAVVFARNVTLQNSATQPAMYGAAELANKGVNGVYTEEMYPYENGGARLVIAQNGTSLRWSCYVNKDGSLHRISETFPRQ